MSAPIPQVATVRPIAGEPTRFHVTSLSNPGAGPHLVDVAAFAGAGKCSCIRWDTVSWPLIRDTGTLPPGKRCRHLRAARELALNITIRQYNDERPTQDE